MSTTDTEYIARAKLSEFYEYLLSTADDIRAKLKDVSQYMEDGTYAVSMYVTTYDYGAVDLMRHADEDSDEFEIVYNPYRLNNEDGWLGSLQDTDEPGKHDIIQHPVANHIYSK